MEMKQCDVLVVGSGGAALKAALTASEHGADTLLITKGKYGLCGATASGVAETGGFCSADGETDPEDNPDIFYNDIIEAGRGMCDPSLARLLADKSAETFYETEKLGVQFDRDEKGHYIQKKSCFTSKPRMHMLQRHGMQIVEVLKKHVIENGVRIIEQTMVTDIITKNNRAVGAAAINEDGEFFVVQAKAVILGTGGAGQLFQYNLSTPEMTGDGYALGYRAGAELKNMEFLQMGEGFVYPFTNIFHPWAWPLQPKVLNSDGEEFLEKYLPRNINYTDLFNVRGTYYPFSCNKESFILDVAIKKEMLSGKMTEHGGVYLDFSESGAGADSEGTELANMWPHMNQWLKSKGIDIKTEKLEVGLMFHAVNGGLCINECAKTTVDMLYAAGEGAAGPHGADRVGGGMLLTCQVFGKIAGENAAENIKNISFEDITKEADRLNGVHKEIAGKKGDIHPDELINIIRQSMWETVMIVRNEETLKRNLNVLKEVNDQVKNLKIESAQEIRKYYELKNMLLVGEMITRACLTRKESRGSHYREDYPESSDEWLKFIKIYKDHDDMAVSVL